MGDEQDKIPKMDWEMIFYKPIEEVKLFYYLNQLSFFFNRLFTRIYVVFEKRTQQNSKITVKQCKIKKCIKYGEIV